MRSMREQHPYTLETTFYAVVYAPGPQYRFGFPSDNLLGTAAPGIWVTQIGDSDLET